MVRDPGQVRVREGDPSKGGPSQNFPGRRLSLLAKEESRSRTEIGVTPAVEDDSGNVAAGIESRTREHLAELLPKLALLLAKGGGDQLGASEMPLLLG